ncbi:putative RNA-directed DNA polymerase from transposon BS [Stylophora pistillata]|uniref:Putative RNA-directed DNA polymerase from transposon BS n=1 Tax=Stylophora pistillata TaxID=50429 RepID=A0A2B4SU11_STYPI|nr:putative RNA-directed DNA polymerase from transposon BS [Stylophora pistillata]
MQHLVGLLLLSGDISSNLGPLTNISGLYLNSRSIVNKIDEFQALTMGKDLIESWLKLDIMNSEILPTCEFTIHRRDREARVDGGIFLAVRNNIICLRRSDLEGNAEILACELRLNQRRKLLAIVFYRPPNRDLEYLKEFKKTLRLASKANFDQVMILGDFNLPNIDWSTGTATSCDTMHNYFPKIIKDNYLWQLIDFPTREPDILDVFLITIPTKRRLIHGFDDIIATDHKVINFQLELKIPKRPKIMRSVYNFKRADWCSLKQTLECIPWDMCFVSNNVNACLSNWCDLFLSAVYDHVPKCKRRNVLDPPWIDNELLSLLKKKDAARKNLAQTNSSSNKAKYNSLRSPAPDSPLISHESPYGVNDCTKLDSVMLIVTEVMEALSNIDPSKAGGPDDISGSLLKHTAAEIAPSLCRLFNMSQSTGSFPANWKRAYIAPVFKKGDPTLAENYRPISLHALSPKLWNDLCLITGTLIYRLFFTNSSMASSQENPQKRNYLRYQRVVVDGRSSDWFPVTSGVPQGSILGPLLSLVFINDVSCSITHGSKLGLFADDSKLYRPIVSNGGASLLQADLDNSRTWCDDNGMSFSTNKCKVLHMSKRTLRQREKHTYHLDGQTLDSPSDTKDLGVTVATPLS